MVRGQSKNRVAGAFYQTAIALLGPALGFLCTNRLSVKFIELSNVLLCLLILVRVIPVKPVQKKCDGRGKNEDVMF